MNSLRLTSAQNDALNAMLEGKHVAFVCDQIPHARFIMSEIMKVAGKDATELRSQTLIRYGKNQGSIKFITPDTEVRGMDFQAIFTDDRRLITSDIQWCLRVQAYGAPV